MKNVKPTFRNVVFFALAFQVFPAALFYLTLLANPDPQKWAVAMMIALSELVLVFFLLSWKRKTEVEIMDEREIAIQLQVKSFMLNVSWITMGVVFLLHMSLFHAMPTWVALAPIVISGLVAEVYANWYYRK